MNETLRKEGNQLLGFGLGVGAWGAATGVLLGSVCPLCLVAGPALLGAGLVRRWQAARSGCPQAGEPSKERDDG